MAVPVISEVIHTSSTAVIATTSSTPVGQDVTLRSSTTNTAAAITTQSRAMTLSTVTPVLSTSTTAAAVVSTTSSRTSLGPITIPGSPSTSTNSGSVSSTTVTGSVSVVRQSTTVVVVTPSSTPSTSMSRAPTITSTISVSSSSTSSSSSSSTASSSAAAAAASTSSTFKLSTPIIAGIAAAGGLVVLVALVLFILAIKRSKRRGREEKRTSNLRGWTENRMSVMNPGLHGAGPDEDGDVDVTPYGMDGGREDKFSGGGGTGVAGWQGQEKYGSLQGHDGYFAEPGRPLTRQQGPSHSTYPQQPYPPQQQQPYPGQAYPFTTPVMSNRMTDPHRDTYASAPRSVSGSASGYGYPDPQSPYAPSGAEYASQSHRGQGMGQVGMAVTPESASVGGLEDGMRVVVRQGFVRSMEDELMITPGDELLLVSSYDDGWCLCENLQRQRGVVPLNCLEQIRAGGTPITSPTIPTFPSSASSRSFNGLRMDTSPLQAQHGDSGAMGGYPPSSAQSAPGLSGLGVSVPQVNIERSTSPVGMSAGGASAAPSYAEAIEAGGSSVQVPKEKSAVLGEARMRKTDSLAPSFAPSDPRWSNRRSSLLANYRAANLFLDDPAHSGAR